jgi:glyoxylase-like metal-dependent hydrolase (beta-lactamase superfamily II)
MWKTPRVSVWDEVGDNCFRRRYRSFDLNIGVVRGADGFLVIDTRCHAGEARELLDELRTLGRAPVRSIVNSHWHFDHCWGNATLRDEYPGVEIWGHERIPALVELRTPGAKAWVLEQHPEWADELDALVVVPPDHLVQRDVGIDLGDREVVVRHPGRGHTDNDLVVTVADAGVVFAGDIVEESGPPLYGEDSFPLEWPATNTRLLEWIAPNSTVVPGHGDVIDRPFVVDQLAAITRVAVTIRALHDAGVRGGDALEAGDWPFPRERMADAVARGFAQLTRS